MTRISRNIASCQLAQRTSAANEPVRGENETVFCLHGSIYIYILRIYIYFASQRVTTITPSLNVSHSNIFSHDLTARDLECVPRLYCPQTNPTPCQDLTPSLRAARDRQGQQSRGSAACVGGVFPKKNPGRSKRQRRPIRPASRTRFCVDQSCTQDVPYRSMQWLISSCNE